MSRLFVDQGVCDQFNGRIKRHFAARHRIRVPFSIPHTDSQHVLSYVNKRNVETKNKHTENISIRTKLDFSVQQKYVLKLLKHIFALSSWSLTIL